MCHPDTVAAEEEDRPVHQGHQGEAEEEAACTWSRAMHSQRSSNSPQASPDRLSWYTGPL